MFGIGTRSCSIVDGRAPAVQAPALKSAELTPCSARTERATGKATARMGRAKAQGRARVAAHRQVRPAARAQAGRSESLAAGRGGAKLPSQAKAGARSARSHEAGAKSGAHRPRPRPAGTATAEPMPRGTATTAGCRGRAAGGLTPTARPEVRACSTR